MTRLALRVQSLFLFRCVAEYLAACLNRNGAKETRTPDPLHAMQVLYQLSYGPIGLAGAACGSACLWKAYTLTRTMPQALLLCG
jgi:hypothetical protein